MLPISRFRANAYQFFMQHIDTENSVHLERYLKMKQRFETADKAQPFKLPSESVLKRVLHALESRQPRIRYPVTFPTSLFAVLKRLLSDRTLDRILRRVN